MLGTQSEQTQTHKRLGVTIGGIKKISGFSSTLPETNIAPKNGWLEYKPFLLGFGLFSGAFWLVSGRVGIFGDSP